MVLSTSSEPNIMFETSFVQCNVSVTRVVICNVEMMFYDYLICTFLYIGCQLCKCVFFQCLFHCKPFYYQLDGFEILLQEIYLYYYNRFKNYSCGTYVGRKCCDNKKCTFFSIYDSNIYGWKRCKFFCSTYGCLWKYGK